jgi:hypothetical protein
VGEERKPHDQRARSFEEIPARHHARASFAAR